MHVDDVGSGRSVWMLGDPPFLARESSAAFRNDDARRGDSETRDEPRRALGKYAVE